MEALAISAANLDAISDNIGAVAENLNGVISNVTDVSNHVEEVDNKVSTLNNKVKDLITEIQENTTITNARQSIMYNNTLIEKKFGYYDNVRRNTISLLDVIENSNISLDAINNLKENLLLNNPNYWLANALAALSNWILDNQEECYNEVNNALRKNEEKTSIFFCLINLKLNRIEASLDWLKKYLSLENPIKLDRDFITIIDLVATGTFGDSAKKVILDKIEQWHKELNRESLLKEKQIKKWTDYIFSKTTYKDEFNHLISITNYSHIIYNNLNITSTYKEVLNSFKSINYENSSNKTIDQILEDLIYEYEDKEKEYEKDNLKNKLIIESNGDRQKAEELYNKINTVTDTKTDLLSLLSNIVINSEYYEISSETKKIALALSKQYIIESYNKLNSSLNLSTFDINYNEFKISTKDGKNIDEAKQILDAFISEKYSNDDKLLSISLLVANIVGIVGICLTINNKLLNTLLLILVITSNIIILFKLYERNKLRERAKKLDRESNLRLIESDLAETLDYYNYIIDNSKYFNELETYIENINIEDYIKSNKERNLNIGE